MSGRLPPAAWLHAGLAVLGAVATVIGLWAVSGVALVWLLAVALAGRAGQAPWHLPTAWVLVVGGTSAVALAADVVGVELLSHTPPTRALVACAVLGAGALCAARLATAAVEAAPGTAPARTFSAAAVLGGAGLLLALLPGTRSVQWAMGGDHIHHLLFVAQVERAGGLDYAVESYPRAWHTLPATLAAVRGDAGPQTLRHLVAVTATSTWTSYVVLVMATAVAGARYATAVGAPERQRAWAGALAGWLVSWPTVWVTTSGSASRRRSSLRRPWPWWWGSACARRARPGLSSSRSWRRVSMCHVWQLLVPVVGLAALLAVAAWLRARRRSPRALVALVAGCGVALTYAAPALTAVLGVGLDHATDAGLDPRVPWVWALLGVAATALLLRTWRTGRGGVDPAGPAPRPGGGVTTLATAALGLALAARFGLSPLTYYPGKLLWHTAVLGMVALPAGVLFLLRSAGRLATVAVVPVVTSVVVGLGLVAPAYALTGRLSNVDADLVLAAATTPAADRRRGGAVGPGPSTTTS